MVTGALVLGGGLAGGAVALLLARQGTAVRLLERDSEPRDKICGEFLSIEAQRDLDHLGIDLARLGAVPIDRVRLSAGNREIEAALPFVARGISRKLLDEVLLEKASEAGARIERGVRVTAIEAGQVATSVGPCRAARIFLATGKHDVRGARRTDPATRGGYVGFKMHWRVRSPGRIAGAIELMLFDGGYAGLQLVAPDVLNLCLIVRKDRLAPWDQLLAELMREPGLARHLAEAEPLFAQPLTIANLPYGYVCRPEDDLYRLGDQAAMTASLTGDGMAVALRSAHLAAASESAPAYYARLRQQVSGQVRRAMLLQRATEAPLAMQAGLAVLRLWPRLLATFASATRLPQWQAT